MNDTWFDVQKGALLERATASLREKAIHNRARLPPFQLPAIARQIVGGLVDFAAGRGADAAAKLGGELGRRGLSLTSLQALGRALLARVQDAQAGEGPLLVVVEFMNVLTLELVEADILDLRQQRDDMHLALSEALKSREQEMHRVIQELSTPIMPIYEGVLALPLIGQIDGERAQRITERLLVAITQQRAKAVIIDITGVPTMDQDVAAALVRVAQAVRLLGASVLVVGVRPEIARTLVELSVDMTGLVTLADLESGIAVALRRLGLAVQEARPKKMPRAEGQRRLRSA